VPSVALEMAAVDELDTSAKAPKRRRTHEEDVDDPTYKSLRPAGCDAPCTAGEDGSSDEVGTFDESLPDGFSCPSRLQGCNEVLVQTVRDFHYPMLRDTGRNRFFWDALASVPVRGKCVLDLGAGSGLLSLMAARLGARKVVAIESSRAMADIARANVQSNGLAHVVEVIHGLSSAVDLADSDRGDVIVSETLGSLLLTEGSLRFMEDARVRLAAGARIVPAGGSQFVTLVASPSLRAPDGVSSSGLNFTPVTALRDTATMRKGFGLGSLKDITNMSERLCVLTIDFATSVTVDLPQVQTFRVRALQAGRVDAAVACWEIWSDTERSHRLSTHLEDLQDPSWGFNREVHWGPMVQLLEDTADGGDSALPTDLVVKEGEEIELTVRFSTPHRDALQVTVKRCRVDLCTSRTEVQVAKEACGIVAPSAGAAGGLDTALPKGFWCPSRLRQTNEALVEVVGSRYASMLSHQPWHEFFWHSLQDLSLEGKNLLDMRAGMGILSIMAARLGAKVTAVESLPDLVRVLRGCAARNDVEDLVRVVSEIGKRPVRKRKSGAPVDVIVSENFSGATLLGEGFLQDLGDARRLASDHVQVLPAGGAQFVTLIMAPSLRGPSKAQFDDLPSIDLSALEVLIDTATMCSTSQDKAFRLASLPDLVLMSDRLCLFSLDFSKARSKDVPLQQAFSVRVLRDGQIDAAVASWEIWSQDKRRQLDTHVQTGEDTSWNYAHDLHWGQGLQLIEGVDSSDSSAGPVPFLVRAGEELTVTVSHARPLRHTFQVKLARSANNG